MSNQRNFKPRKLIPKKQLLSLLEEGYTLDDIGEKYHKSRSYISECCTIHGIKVSEIDGRREKMRQRYKEKKNRPFIDVLYEKIDTSGNI